MARSLNHCTTAPYTWSSKWTSGLSGLSLTVQKVLKVARRLVHDVCKAFEHLLWHGVSWTWTPWENGQEIILGLNSVKTSSYHSTMHVSTWPIEFSTNQVPIYRKRSDVLHPGGTYRLVILIPLDPKRKPRNALQMTTSNGLWNSAQVSSSWTTLQTVYNDMSISSTPVQMLVVSYSTAAIPSTMSIVEHVSVTLAPYMYPHNIT
jgi:hypothetical protein